MSAQRFRKKPVVVEAVQFVASPDGTGTNAGEVSQFIGSGHTFFPNGNSRNPRQPVMTIDDPVNEGDHDALVGDWVIKGTRGEFYACKPDIFAATYEPVDTEVPA